MLGERKGEKVKVKDEREWVLERVRVDLAPAPLKQRACGKRQARTATSSRAHVLLQALIFPATGQARGVRKRSEVVCPESLPCGIE